MNLALVLALVVAPITTSFSYTQDDVEVLARVVAGEGCGLLGEHSREASIAMVHTLLNNPKSQTWGVRKVAETYYHGYTPDLDPPEWVYRDVITALVLRDQGYDMANGAQYVLSQADLVNHGIPYAADWAVYRYANGPWKLYGFKHYPIGR